jgi:hypothetical protein
MLSEEEKEKLLEGLKEEIKWMMERDIHWAKRNDAYIDNNDRIVLDYLLDEFTNVEAEIAENIANKFHCEMRYKVTPYTAGVVVTFWFWLKNSLILRSG